MSVRSRTPFAPDLIVCDVSFISVRLALPPALALARPGWEAVVLVKPQFEAGRAEVPRGGVVRTSRCASASCVR
jgi:23S rRNA (cytidine1920-2'-O)/16S rRNA (cytidine1409-2'-O)-methyltransferase